MFDATVAIPTVNIVQISDSVISSKCGLTVRADSIPTKMLLEAAKDSAPEIFINFVKTYAKLFIIRGIILKRLMWQY